MRRFAVLSLLMLALGCAPSNPGLVIDGVLALPDNCTLSATSNVFTLQGTLDTSPRLNPLRPLGITYDANFRVTSRLLALFNNRYPLRAEPNVLSMNYAEVEVMQVDGTPYDFVGLPNPFRVAAAGTINPSTSANGVAGIVPVQVIPPIYGDSLADQTGRVIISVRLTGTTSGGATVTSGEYVFPLDLCSYCLVRCDPAVMETDGFCSIGQDRTVTLGADIGCP